MKIEKLKPIDEPQGLSTTEINLRFPGQYFDAESRLHYNYFRDYNPATGRYVQSDPIGLDGGLNAYLYSSGSPVNAIDIYGLIECSCIESSSGRPTNKPKNKNGEYDKYCNYSCSCGSCGVIEIKDIKAENGPFGQICKGVSESGYPPAITQKTSRFDINTDSLWDRFWDKEYVEKIEEACMDCSDG